MVNKSRDKHPKIGVPRGLLRHISFQFLIEGRPATHPDNSRGVDMPPKGGNPALTNENLQQIVVYLRSIQ